MPKGTDLSAATPTWRNDVARLMNGRPRKTLGWKTPAEAMAEEIKAFSSTVALEVRDEAALDRKAWLFAGSDRGGDRTAFMNSLIVTAKLNNIDPQAWLTDVLARMPALKVSRLPNLLP